MSSTRVFAVIDIEEKKKNAKVRSDKPAQVLWEEKETKEGKTRPEKKGEAPERCQSSG